MLCRAACIRTVLWTLLLMASVPVTAADYFAEAKNYHAQGEVRAAVIQLKNLLQQSPDHPQGRLLLGQIYAENGQFAEADKELRRAKALGIAATEFAPFLAEAQVGLQQFDQALNTLFLDWGPDGPDQARRWALIGSARLGQKELGEAENAFYRSIQEQPTPLAQLGLALVAKGYGKDDEALSHLQPIKGDDRVALRAHLLRAELLREKREFEQAINNYSQVLAQDPEHLIALSGRAQSALEGGQRELADSDISKLLELAPQLPQVRLLAAMNALTQQRYEEANTQAQMLLQAIPESPQGLILAGAAHYHLGRLREAEELFRAGLKIAPTHLVANRLLAATLLRQNKPQQALDLIEPLFARGVTDPALKALAGNAHLANGELETGEQLLMEAMEALPSNVALVNQVALSRVLAGRGADAIELLDSENLGDSLQSDAVRVIAMIRNGQADAAITLVRSRITEQPQAISYYLLLALLHQQSGDVDAATRVYYDAAAQAPDNPAPYIGLARLALKAQQFDDAARYFQQALGAHKNHLGAMLGMAAVEEKRNNAEGLLDWLQRARDIHANALAPVQLLSRFYMQQGTPERALAEVQGYYLNHKNNLDAALLYASLLRNNNEPERAAELLAPLLETNRGHPRLQLALAQLFKDLNRLSEALSHTQELVDTHGPYSAAGVLHAELLIMSGKATDADTLLTTLWERKPLPVLSRLRAAAALALNKPLDAHQYLSDLYPQEHDPKLLQLLIRAEHQLNGTAGATRLLQEHIANFPSDPFALMQLASLEHQQGNLETAARHYEKLKALTPLNPIPWNNLAWIYHSTEDPRGLTYAREAYRLAPHSADIQDTLGWILIHNGNKEEGLKLLRRAANGLPNNLEVQYHLARALVDNERSEEARSLLQQLSNQPSPIQSQAQQLLQQLN